MFCPKCGRKLERTKWKPPKGVNRDLVQVACPKGHYDRLIERKHKEKKAEANQLELPEA